MGWSSGRLLELSIVTSAASSSQIWMDDMQCTGNETHVENCSHADSGKWQWGTLSSCSHTNDVGIGCDAYTTTTQNAAYPGIRIITSSGTTNSFGSFSLEGRVEVRKNGIWGTICNSNTDEDA